MQVQTVQGYFVASDKFIPFETTTIPLRKRTIVTFLDEPAQDALLINDDVEKKLAILNDLNALVDASAHEELPLFERAQLSREINL